MYSLFTPTDQKNLLTYEDKLTSLKSWDMHIIISNIQPAPVNVMSSNGICILTPSVRQPRKFAVTKLIIGIILARSVYVEIRWTNIRSSSLSFILNQLLGNKCYQKRFFGNYVWREQNHDSCSLNARLLSSHKHLEKLTKPGVPHQMITKFDFHKHGTLPN